MKSFFDSYASVGETNLVEQAWQDEHKAYYKKLGFEFSYRSEEDFPSQDGGSNYVSTYYFSCRKEKEGYVFSLKEETNCAGGYWELTLSPFDRRLPSIKLHSAQVYAFTDDMDESQDSFVFAMEMLDGWFRKLL